MIKFDIHSACHHVLLQESQTGMLGFSWIIEGEVRFSNFWFCLLVYEVRNIVLLN